MEIDLLAVKGKFAFAVDCKHWKRTAGHASMLRASGLQVSRGKRLIGYSGITRIIPLILTWHDELLGILDNGVPVVSIHRITDFVLNWESSDNILVLTADG